MSYTVKRDDGAEARGESPEEAAALMRGLEDAEAGRVYMARLAFEGATALREFFEEMGVRDAREPWPEELKYKVAMPTHWPLARQDIVRRILREE